MPFRAFLPSQVLCCALALGALPRTCSAWALVAGGAPRGALGCVLGLGATGALLGVGIPAVGVRMLERRARRIFMATL